jgi:glutaredoxin
MDNKIVVISRPDCKYCSLTKDFFSDLGVEITEINLNPDEVNYRKKRNELFKFYNHNSYPIIVIDNKLLGGYNELIYAYDTLKLHDMCIKINIEIPYDF